MKNRIYIIGFLLSLLGGMFFLSCDREVEVKDFYPFKTLEVANSTTFTGYEISIQTTITNDFTYNAPADLSFFLKFTSSKEGYFIKNGNSYNAGEEIPLALDSNIFSYYPTEPGLHKITITYFNNYNEKVEKTLDINVLEPEFDFKLTGVNISPYIGNSYNVNLLIENIKSPEDTEYHFDFILLEGEASIYEDEENTSIMSQNTNYEISPGAIKSIRVQPLSIGDLKIKLVGKNNHGGQIERQINWNINKHNFSFDLNNINYPQGSIIVNNTYHINLFITPANTYTGSVTFKYKYVILEGQAELKNSFGNILDESTEIPIVYGQNVPVNIKPISGGMLKIKFIAIDQYGTEVEQILSWTITVPQFSFNLSNTSYQEIIQLQNYEINLIITPESNYNNGIFEYKYSIIEGNAELKNSDETVLFNHTSYSIAPNQNVPIKIKPLIGGNLKIKFIVTDSFGTTKEQDLSWNVISTDFTLSVNNPNSIIFENIEYSYNVTVNGSEGSTYELEYYEIDNFGNPFGSTNTVTYNYGSGTFAVGFMLQHTGNYTTRTLKFIATNNFGIKKEVLLDIDTISQPLVINDFTVNRHILPSPPLVFHKFKDFNINYSLESSTIVKVEYYINGVIYEDECGNNEQCLDEFSSPNKHISEFPSNYSVKVRVFDSNGNVSPWRIKTYNIATGLFED